jgi:hypothetical protein
MSERRTGAGDAPPSPAWEDGGDDLAFGSHCGPRRRRRFRGAIVGLASILLMVGLACAGGFLLLARGPVEVAFMSDRIAAGLERQFGGGVDVEVGRTVLEQRGSGFGLHVLDIVIKDVRGREILRSPDALVSFHPLQLMKLSIMPERLSLRGMAMRAEITPEGEILFKTSESGAAAEALTSAPVADVVAFALGLGGPGSEGGLSAISIADASLTIEDRRNGKRIAFQNMSLAFESPRPGVIEAGGSLRKEGDVVPFSVVSEAADGGRRLRFAFAGVGDHVLQALLGVKAPFMHLGAKLDASAEVLVGPDAKPLRAVFEAGVGQGAIAVPTLDPQPYRIDRLRLKAFWEAAKPGEAAFSLDFSGEGATLAMAGPLTVPEVGAAPWHWDAVGGGWRMPPVAAGDAPQTVERAELRLTLDPGARSIQVHRLSLRGPGTVIDMSLDAALQDEGPGLTLWLEAGRMSLRNALRWWPSFTAQPARAFFVRSLREGDISRLLLTLAMPPPVFQKALRQEALPREALKLDIAVDGGALGVSAGLPPIAGLTGQGKLDAVEMQGVFERGWVEPKPGRRVSLADGAFAIAALDTWTPEAKFRFKASAGLEAVAELLRAPDLKSTLGVDVDPANVKGQFEGAAAITLPLTRDLKLSDVVTDINGRMTAVTIEKAIGKDKLENANLAVTADRSGFEVRGEGRWQGTPVSLALEKAPGEGRRTAVLALTLDDAALKRRGFNVQGQLQGPLPVRIRSLSDSRDARAQIEVDLGRAAIDGLLPGLQKPAGRPGRLTFEAVERPNGYAIQNIALDTGPSSFRGQADAAADGTVSAARFSLFRLSPGDNVKLDYDVLPTGAKVTIRGNNFDARPFLRAATGGDASRRDADRDLEIDLKTTLLSGHGGEVITGAEARMALRAGQLQQIALAGKLNGRPLSIAGRPAQAGSPVTVDSDDAGALFRYFDLYSRMQGGDLSGQVFVTPRRLTGYLIAKDFVLRDEPAFRRLVAEGEGEAGRQVAGDARFTKMRIDFTRDGTEIAVRDAVIFGPQLGLTFNGMVDPARDRVSLSGTYVPAYGLNNAFAQIPLVGNLLAGGRNEGLLAVTFGVSGRASQPAVTVNPLSAVAPGIFRKIFEFRNDRTGTAPPPAFNPAAN